MGEEVVGRRVGGYRGEARAGMGRVGGYRGEARAGMGRVGGYRGEGKGRYGEGGRRWKVADICTRNCSPFFSF